MQYTAWRFWIANQDLECTAPWTWLYSIWHFSHVCVWSKKEQNVDQLLILLLHYLALVHALSSFKTFTIHIIDTNWLQNKLLQYINILTFTYVCSFIRYYTSKFHYFVTFKGSIILFHFGDEKNFIPCAAGSQSPYVGDRTAIQIMLEISLFIFSP